MTATMLDQPNVAARERILGHPVDAVSKSLAVTAIVERALRGTPGAYVCLTNAHTTLESQQSPELRQSAESAFLSVPDGMPLVWILRRRGHVWTEKVTGIEYMPLVAAAGREAGLKHFLYGGAPGVAEAAAGRLASIVPGTKVVGAAAPPFGSPEEWDLTALKDEIAAKRPHIMWVGLGAPKQEIWMAQVAVHLEVPMMIGVGAGFDFLAGNKRPAPSYMRHIGLEWLFRFLAEPRRLWRRYLVGNSHFAYLLARDTLAARSRRAN